jgi:hypothetical protein
MLMNRPKRVAAGVALVLTASLPALLHADVPPVDPNGVPAVVVCEVIGGAPIPAVHMDKIIFHITGPLVAMAQPDQPALNAVPQNSRLDIKVLDNPRTVADLKAKVLTFLRAAVNPANRNNVVIDDVDYAVVCPRIPNAVPGGG